MDKDVGKLEHFVGCHMTQDLNDKYKIFIQQPKILKHLYSDFKNLLGKPKQLKTTAGPKTTIVRPEKGDKLIKEEEQTINRSGVGILYLVKHSRPEISKAVRERSKVGDGTNCEHWKQLMRTMCFK